MGVSERRGALITISATEERTRSNGCKLPGAGFGLSLRKGFPTISLGLALAPLLRVSLLQ